MKKALIFFALILMPTLPFAQDRLLVAVTTSIENSGLLEHLQPKIYEQLGINPQFIVTGSGKALRLGMNKDVDLIWVHDPQSEEAFMTAGYGTRREQVMFNRFLLVGPKNDPAQATKAPNLLNALQQIELSKSLFVSRGDDSGTHRREKSFWRNINPKHPILSSNPLSWYRELGMGMGATLNSAIAMNAYTIVDEATWRKHENTARHRIIWQNDALLRNPYGAIVVANTNRIQPNNFAHKFTDWLISAAGQTAITTYKIKGSQGFYRIKQ